MIPAVCYLTSHTGVQLQQSTNGESETTLTDLKQNSNAQAALSAAVRRTMPQHTQHPLIHVLLFWITILSVIQIVFIALFFTHGHMSQNTSAVAAGLKEQTQANNTSSLSSADGTLLGKMLSFTAEEEVEGTDVGTITWKNISRPSLVSLQGNVLTLLKDGYYFLNLRVTLCSSNPRTLTVSLRKNEEVLLEGWINPNTNSTGLLGKVEKLSAATRLSVSIFPSANNINYTALVTYLDIIYMPNNKND